LPPANTVVEDLSASIVRPTAQQENLPWQHRLAKYRQQNNRRGFAEIALTILLFVALWAATWFVSRHNYWLSLLLVPFAAAFLVRIFLLQHECGHGTLFTRRRVNDWVGRFLGVLSLTPYDYWRSSHAQHHAGSGNLDRRGIGDIELLTVREYQTRGQWARLKYRLYRHPLVMFGLGPTYLFVAKHRLPCFRSDCSPASWAGIWATNVGIGLSLLILGTTLGWREFLGVQLPVTVLAASMGVWLFYIQHQFEETFWEHSAAWSPEQAALKGSSFFDMPKPLHWLTANIGFHHLHHLSSRIPFYRLPKVMEEMPELGETRRLRWLESAKCLRLTLWDEQTKRLVSFKHAKLLPIAG
jgi:acyl-lipid omega-6 desaturase (Delta-12 desaturase)